MAILLVCTFIIGYIAIATEHSLKINKAASALLTGVLCWTICVLFSEDKEVVVHHLNEHLGEISGILFFLLGAMTIVELIDAHDGFLLITERIKTKNKRTLLWLISIITFFLSALLDNLTTTIVIVSLLRKIIKEKNDRLLFAGMVVIAANAGGAWSPIGDVTTTMLWLGGQISTVKIITHLFLPSMICLLLPLIALSFFMKGQVETPEQPEEKTDSTSFERTAVFFIGIAALLFVPIYKTITHLPPYMGILFGLGVMWVLTEIIHSEKDEADKNNLSVLHALRKIDTPSILFFLGILISIGALQSAGLLTQLAQQLNAKIGNESLIVIMIGILSSVIDNVPLVAAAQGMYSLQTYPTDHFFWLFLTYASGTGGSCLIIGSAAGVAAMGMENIPFFWYLKRISLLALLGFLAGAGVYLLQYRLIF
ncbi:MAG TPA: sodium:proton antiporter NhaD [Chitinophagales bacterium]|nr:sodium:proton antiporter NhaD [Chitinophagales bacterium]